MKNTLTVHRGQVFYAELKNDGTSRQSGIRPIIICSNEQANRFSSIISCVSLTSSKTKNPLPTHIHISASESGLKLDSIALCEQPLSISKSDLKEYVCTLNEECMQKVSQGLRIQLAL